MSFSYGNYVNAYLHKRPQILQGSKNVEISQKR